MLIVNLTHQDEVKYAVSQVCVGIHVVYTLRHFVAISAMKDFCSEHIICVYVHKNNNNKKQNKTKNRKKTQWKKCTTKLKKRKTNDHKFVSPCVCI